VTADDDRTALEELDLRLKTILPPEYQDSYESLQPVPMGSAGLKFGRDGKVAWNEIWGSFCDLAMAGGPPHKGKLLQPASRAEIDAQPEQQQAVIDEICRGVMMVTALPADPSPHPGWIRVECLSETMAGWLLRAITTENVAARQEGLMLDLPAAPHFQLMKEIKNVVTVIAKTCHYWNDHMPRQQQRAIARLFADMAQTTPLLAPAFPIEPEQTGWRGVECPSVVSAIWMMRALVVSNVLSRREGTVLFVPINPASDPRGERVDRALTRIRAFAITRGLI
jgi:hypothetical protein